MGRPILKDSSLLSLSERGTYWTYGRRLVLILPLLLAGIPACSQPQDPPSQRQTNQIPAAAHHAAELPHDHVAGHDHAGHDHAADHVHDDDAHSNMFVGNPVSKSIWDRVLALETLKPDARAKLAEDTIAYLESGDVTEEQLNLAIIVAQVVYSGENESNGGEAYKRIALLAAKSTRRVVKARADELAGVARRLLLLGNKIELDGQTVDERKFDWTAYQGKVVLINFWATSCAVCREELPNVQTNYQRFHDLGFEIVGIPLDADRETVATFLEEQQIPWTNLFDSRGRDHPLAQRFGVVATPTVLLVDQRGEVISLDAYGRKLGDLLEQSLVTKTDNAPASSPDPVRP